MPMKMNDPYGTDMLHKGSSQHFASNIKRI